MSSRLTLNIFEQAASRFTAAEAEVLKDWHLPCNCQSPGERPNCQNCPYFKELVELIQAKLHPEPTKVFPTMLLPEIKPPYQEEVKQQCLDLHERGYPLEKIQGLTGVTNRRTLRHWIRQAGRLKTGNEYSPEEKQRYLNLYADGMSPQQIEDLTGVSADLVSDWVKMAGVAKSRRGYSDEQKQRVLALYEEERELKEIEALTGVRAITAQSIAKRANLHRARRYGGGRPPRHPPEFKKSCQKLLQEGKSPPQIEELLGVSADTVRRWKKEWEHTAQALSPENESNTSDEAGKPG
jgi:transposase-like protein